MGHSRSSRPVNILYRLDLVQDEDLVFGPRRVFICTLLLGLLTTSGNCCADPARRSKLYRSLIGRSEAVRIRALKPLHLGLADRREALDDLIAAAQQHAGSTESDQLARPSTIALINLIADVKAPESELLLVDLLDAEHLGISMLAAEALGQKRYHDSIDALKKQTDRPEFQSMYAFRFNLIRAFALMEHPDAIEYIAELRRSLDGQLRFHVDKILQDATLELFDGDEERFAALQAARNERKGDNSLKSLAEPLSVGAPEPAKPDSLFKTAKYEPESLQRLHLQRQQYYGIDINANKLMFIIDNSGSMKNYWGGMTRLERAKAELVRAINQLPPETEFAIVFFNTVVRHWRGELSLATEENKLEATNFVRRLGYGDRTNTYGALRYSLNYDDQLESVFLLTDGHPTIGEIKSKPAIITDILGRNRFRHLNFNTIGIAVDKNTRAFLEKLATESNGEFREAR